MKTHYDLNDLQADVGHLAHLIEAIAEITVELDPTAAPEIGRLNAFAWVARDLVADLDKKDFAKLAGSIGG